METERNMADEATVSSVIDPLDDMAVEMSAHVQSITLDLRLSEAQIYLRHLKSLRRNWAIFSILCWVFTFGSFSLALWPYIGGASHFEVPIVISYVSAFLIVVAGIFAFVSSYRTMIASGLISRVTFRIKRARAVQAVYGEKVSLIDV